MISIFCFLLSISYFLSFFPFLSNYSQLNMCRHLCYDFVLFCFVLICFVLFCFVLFYFVLFYFILSSFVLFCFILFLFVVMFYFILFVLRGIITLPFLFLFFFLLLYLFIISHPLAAILHYINCSLLPTQQERHNTYLISNSFSFSF